MKRIIFGALVLTMLPTVHVMAENTVQLSIAPEIWYAKWQPGFKDPADTTEVQYASYKVDPSVLCGVAVSMLYGDYGLFGSYLMAKSEKAIESSAGYNTSALTRDLRLAVLGRLSDTWYLKNSISSGRFKGNAVGVEWARGGGPESAKSLPVDTNWFQGDISMIFVWPEMKEATGAGGMLGFRYLRYNLPAQVETYDSMGLSKVSFLDTSFSTLMLTFGAEALPGIRKDWQISVPRFAVGYGITKVTNSAMSGKSCFKEEKDYGPMFEFDTAIVHSSDNIDFELGVRYRTSNIIAGKGGYDDTEYKYNPGSRVKMSERFFGPYTRIAFHF
ncbi:MAG: hypothetical protein NTX59_02555 [Elusimicrobia bacterium]|nr:hypothetical protein [Elusimicrobiota bacterium]